MKPFLYFGLSVLSLIIAVVILIKSLDITSLFILLFSLAAGILFWLGIKEYQKDRNREAGSS